MSTTPQRVSIYRITMRITGDIFLVTEDQHQEILKEMDAGKQFIHLRSFDVQALETINIRDIQSIRLDLEETSAATKKSFLAGQAIINSSGDNSILS